MHIPIETHHWILFNLGILILLAIDLFRFYLHPHAISIKEAAWTSVGWISLALLFNIWIYVDFGAEPALNFLAGYLLEKSLSIDNLFIFLLIFAHFQVPDNSKHLVLFYGVLGAVVMRALLILTGIELVSHYEWILEIFAVFLIYMGIKLAFTKEQKIDLEKNYIYQKLQSWINITPNYHGQSFFIKENNKWLATPLLAVIILIESIDLLFAIDSVPAVLGITTDPFIVYTSNIFAILGLRSLFFVLEGMMKHFYLLHYAVALILVLIGCKIVAENFIKIPVYITLGSILLLIISALIGSHLFPLSAKPKQDE